jgi:Recombinase
MATISRERSASGSNESSGRTSTARVLARLGLARDGVKGLAVKRAVNVRAIHKLRKTGLSARAIARELNAREIPTALGGKWHTTSVYRLLERLGNLDRAYDTAVRTVFLPVESN